MKNHSSMKLQRRVWVVGKVMAADNKKISYPFYLCTKLTLYFSLKS